MAPSREHIKATSTFYSYFAKAKKVFEVSFNVGFYQGFKFFRQDSGINLQNKTFFLFLSLVVKFPAT